MGSGISFWPMASHHVAHAGGGLVFVGDDDGGLSARRDEARTSLTASPSVALIFSSRGFSASAFSGVGLVLQVVAGGRLVDGLQVDVAVLVDGGEDDLIDVVIEDEDFDVLLLVDLEQGRVAQHAFGAAGDVVERLLLGLHA